MTWAELMKRVFDLAVLKCPVCRGPMKIIAEITEPRSSSGSWLHWTFRPRCLGWTEGVHHHAWGPVGSKTSRGR